MKITLRSRIYLAILPLLLLFIGITTYVMINADQVQRGTNALNETNIQLNKSFDKINYSLNGLEALLELESPKSIMWARARIPLLIKSLDQSIHWNTTSQDNHYLNTWHHDTDAYLTALQKLSEQAHAFANDKLSRAEFANAIQASSTATTEIESQWLAYNEAEKTKLRQQTRHMLNVVIASMLVGTAITLLASTLLWQRIFRPIEELTSGMEAFNADSKPLNIAYKARDELGELSRSFERMTTRLQALQQLNSQKLMRSTAALRSILEHSPDAFFIISAQGIPTYSNPIATELLNESSLRHGFPDTISALFKRALDEKKPIFTQDFKDAIRITTKETDRWFLVQAFPINIPSEDLEDDEATTTSVAAFFQNVTGLKLSNSLREDLIATVSHELKTPITSARMSLYLLLEESLGPLNETQKELLETARDDVNRQLSTIEHLLDISKIEADNNNLQFTRFNVTDLIHETVTAHAELASASDIRLDWQRPEHSIQIEADRKCIGIVLNNFVINAIKYSGHGKQIEIQSTLNKDYVTISVKDNGPGIDTTELDVIFDAYTRTTQTKTIKGTGLGLKISKDLIEKHSGKIGCHSVPGEGSTFFVELPLSQSTEPQAPQL
jgi:signal transduction histidine kinase/HAMP domain-containing protein